MPFEKSPTFLVAVKRLVRALIVFPVFFLPDWFWRFRWVRRLMGGTWARVPSSLETEDCVTREALGRMQSCGWILRSSGWLQVDDLDADAGLRTLVAEEYPKVL